MTRYELINILIARRGYKSYLEIGVDTGDCFNKVKCDKKVGVDPYIGSGRTEHDKEEYQGGPATHVMTSDLFFEKNEDKFDIIFIDGLHEADQVERDINNAFNCTGFEGMVVVHDCLPLTEEAQRVPRGDVWGWNGDAWKAIVRTRVLKGVSVRTVDTDQGCTIFGPWPPDSVFTEKALPETWELFNTNRTKLMNIITIPEFLRIA